MTKTIPGLLAEYATRRNKAQALYQREMEEYQARHPRYAALRQEKEAFLAESLARILAAPADKDRILGEMRQEQARIDGLLAEEQGDSLPRPRYACPLCEDTGLVGGAYCDCLMERIYTEVLGGKALPGHLVFDPAVYPTVEQKKAGEDTWEALQALAEGYPKLPFETVVLTGEAGLGKTHLMALLGQLLQKKTRRILYMDAYTLFDLFHRVRLGEEGLPTDLIFTTDVLLIDDLGTEPMTANVTREQMFRLLEQRKGRLTLFTTNLPEDQLKARYTEKVYSRLLRGEKSARISFHGKDLRGKQG